MRALALPLLFVVGCGSAEVAGGGSVTPDAPPPPRVPVCAVSVKVRPITTQGAPAVVSEPWEEGLEREGGKSMLFAGSVGDKAVRVTQGRGRVVADIYDPAADRWARVESPQIADLADSRKVDLVRAFVAGPRLVITWDGDPTAQTRWVPRVLLAVVLDVGSATFRPMPAEGMPGTFRGHVTFAGGSLLVWYGAPLVSPPPIRWEEGYRFDFDKWKWSRLPSEGAPSERSRAIAETVGSRVVVWGGGTGSFGGKTTMLGDGAVFDVSSDKWSAITSKHAPPARHDAVHGAGDHHVLVWGGHDGSSDTSSAFVYDVQQDHWAEARGASRPQFKVTESLVWGGRVVRAGDRIAAILKDATWVIDLPSATWASVGAPPLLPAKSVEVGRSGVAFVGAYGRTDAPNDAPIVLLDLVENRFCAPQLPSGSPLHADNIALLWGTQRGFGAWGAIQFRMRSCPSGAPCAHQAPPMQTEQSGVMVEW